MSAASDRRISDDDLRVLAAIHAKTGGRPWEPPQPRHPFVLRMIEAGMLERRDGRFLFEAFKDSHLAFTEAGAKAVAEAPPAEAEPAPETPTP